MLLRQLRRFIPPPKCLVLDSLTDTNECGIFLKSTDKNNSNDSLIYIFHSINGYPVMVIGV
jgi:hypothetical protein